MYREANSVLTPNFAFSFASLLFCFGTDIFLDVPASLPLRLTLEKEALVNREDAADGVLLSVTFLADIRVIAPLGAVTLEDGVDLGVFLPVDLPNPTLGVVAAANLESMLADRDLLGAAKSLFVEGFFKILL
jgi:hypothetical protein